MTDHPTEPESVALSEEERAAALRAGSNPVPVKLLIRICLAMALLVAAITGLERFFGGGGTTPISHSTATGTTRSEVTRSHSPLNAPLTDLLGLKEIASATAADFTLSDQYGRRWSLIDQRGRIVVLTFFDSQCHDICPVLAAEISDAEAALPQTVRSHVTFAVVNTNPLHTALSAQPPALTSTGLDRSSNVVFLTGSLNTLNSIWTNYGIQVSVTKSHVVTHNNLIYFISRKNKLTALAVPFGNQSHNGEYSLSAALEKRFGLGIAEITTNLDKS